MPLSSMRSAVSQGKQWEELSPLTPVLSPFGGERETFVTLAPVLGSSDLRADAV
jgi:hypothetical protein